MAQIPSKQRRTQYIIAKDFQLRFALLLSGVGLAVTSVIGFILYSVLARAQSLFVGTGMVLSPSLIEEIVHSLKMIHGYGSLEIYVQDNTVTQITVRNIKKTSTQKQR